MLYTNYTEKLLGLEDAFLKDVEHLSDGIHIHIQMHKRIHDCPRCGNPTSKVHDYRIQEVKDVPMLGLPTVLHIRKRRHKCPYCGKIFSEHISFLPRYQRTTNRLWGYVIGQLASEKSMSRIGKEVSLSGTSIARILDHVSYRPKGLPQVLSIDEFRGNTDGEKFQCILTDPKKRKVIDILPARRSDTLHEYFGSYNDRSNVKIVVMDMSSFFKNVMHNIFPKADIIADKFHVVRQVTWAFENVRKVEQKKFAASRRKYFKRSRTLLLKDKQKLKPEELEQVVNMLQISKRLAQAYYLKNEFYEVMKSKDLAEAKKRMFNWMMHAQTAALPEFEDCIKTYINWQTEILNAFKYGYTNGFTEGCNNRIKVIKRTGYGLQNFKRFRLCILHVFAN